MKSYQWKLQWGMFPTEACIWPRGPQLVNRLWNLRRWSLARGRTSLGVLWGCLALSYFLFPLCFLFMSKDWFSWFPVPALLPCLPPPPAIMDLLSPWNLHQNTLLLPWVVFGHGILWHQERGNKQRPLLMDMSSVLSFHGADCTYILICTLTRGLGRISIV